jgi:hypothetical protein
MVALGGLLRLLRMDQVAERPSRRRRPAEGGETRPVVGGGSGDGVDGHALTAPGSGSPAAPGGAHEVGDPAFPLGADRR